MASRRELQRLEDENRTLSQRLTDTEVELSRKEDELKAASVRFALFLCLCMLETFCTHLPQESGDAERPERAPEAAQGDKVPAGKARDGRAGGSGCGT